MHIDQVAQYLDQPQQATRWLASLGIRDTARAHRNLVGMAQAGMTIDLITSICNQLSQLLPLESDPDMALNNLERFVQASRSPLALGALFERDPGSLPILLKILSTSQHLSDLLIRDPESYDLLRLTEGQPVARAALIADLASEITRVHDERTALLLLRRFKHREILRIAYGDIVDQQHIASTTSQISFVADAICEASIRFARRQLEAQWGVPRRAEGQAARFVILGLGKLGGNELNYSSDIDLVMVYDVDGMTDGEKSRSNREFFERLTRDVVKLLAEPTEFGLGYRVDLRLRPEGSQGPVVNSLEGMLNYYDTAGRTWERQAFVKARPVAGDLDLGTELLQRLEPWIYRHYLSRADIAEIKALKRRIEHRTLREGEDLRNVKTGLGGIRDVEFVIQFLQLLNGRDLKTIRTGNTLEGIIRLEEAGCLTLQERSLLERNYAFLRKIEHRLQIMLDLQTHTVPEDVEELRKLAIRLGFVDNPQRDALTAFQTELKKATALNRKILDHLLHDAFSESTDTEPEVDLVLDPAPPESEVDQLLCQYHFKDTQTAYRNLVALSVERIPFLSTRRCRHFLASIARRLLAAISQTPDPDSTLLNLEQVSDSLGGKGMLWELFSFNPPSLQLYVTLCATSPYLSGILTSNPGMLDELMDSLVLDKLPSRQYLHETLQELCRAAEDLDPILHSFKNAQHLRVGVRDILGKEDIRQTQQSLSDVAEVLLNTIVQHEYDQLIEKLGVPIAEQGPGIGQPSEFVILALGKFGGREPNYRSDLDVVFMYDGEGNTQHRRADQKTSNQHFFSQLASKVIKVVTQIGPYGRLFEIDPRLRPTGKSGALTVSFEEFTRYFSEGQGQLWERQALCKSRTIYGSREAQQRATDLVYQVVTEVPWRSQVADEIRSMRQRMQANTGKNNLKRGVGGTVDVEFAIQMLQLKHAVEHPAVLKPGTLDAAGALAEAGLLDADDASFFYESYRFLRSAEAGLRLMNTTARHDLPDDPLELTKLAHLLRFESGDALIQQYERLRNENRSRFDRLFDQAARS